MTFTQVELTQFDTCGLFTSTCYARLHSILFLCLRPFVTTQLSNHSTSTCQVLHKFFSVTKQGLVIHNSPKVETFVKIFASFIKTMITWSRVHSATGLSGGWSYHFVCHAQTMDSMFQCGLVNWKQWWLELSFFLLQLYKIWTALSNLDSAIGSMELSFCQ